MPLQEKEPEIRLSFDIPESLHNKLQSLIPWGVRSTFYRKLMEVAAHKLERGGPAVLGAVIRGDIDPFLTCKED